MVKAYIGSHILEINPTSSWGSAAIEVKLNGVPKTIRENVPVELKAPSGEIICIVEKKGDMIHAHVPKLSIKLETNCHKIHMHVSHISKH